MLNRFLVSPTLIKSSSKLCLSDMFSFLCDITRWWEGTAVICTKISAHWSSASPWVGCTELHKLLYTDILFWLMFHAIDYYIWLDMWTLERNNLVHKTVKCLICVAEEKFGYFDFLLYIQTETRASQLLKQIKTGRETIKQNTNKVRWILLSVVLTGTKRKDNKKSMFNPHEQLLV